MKVAGLDLGTNSFLCLIAEVENQQIKKIYSDDVEIVRLGQDVQKTKKFHPDALVRADKCLAQFSKIIKREKPEKILAMATSAARDVQNAAELFALGKKHQIPIEIIPGEKEADITYSGSTSGIQNQKQRILVVDIGGGSTELIIGQNNKIIMSQSLNIGCVRLTEQFLSKQPADDKILIQLEQKIRTELNTYFHKIDSANTPEYILAVAGTPTELVRAEIGEFNAQKIESFRMTHDWLTKKLKLFSSLTPKEIHQIHGIQPGRADVIVVGIMILKSISEIMNQKEIHVGTRGVRYGVALEAARR